MGNGGKTKGKKRLERNEVFFAAKNFPQEVADAGQAAWRPRGKTAKQENCEKN